MACHRGMLLVSLFWLQQPEAAFRILLYFSRIATIIQHEDQFATTFHFSQQGVIPSFIQNLAG